MNQKRDYLENEWIEIELLLEAIYKKYGYDFREYGDAHLRRRIKHRLSLSDLSSIGEMQHKIVHDEQFFNTLLLDLSINVTEMFRDPKFYIAVKEKVLPYLRTYPHIKIWHAGCSAGQEVYSLRIILHEEDLMSKSQIYATDFNEMILARAISGIYPLDCIKEYTKNYQKAEGKFSFSDYYIADYESAIIKQFLRDDILFSQHNLVTDTVFGEMNMIFCRNVLIYFNKNLQNKVLKLFYESLVPGGFLCLGSKETLKFSDYETRFDIIDLNNKIYRKKR